MRPLRQALICISFIFFSCGQSQQKETPAKQDSLSQATILHQTTIKKNYLPLNMDTVVLEEEISLYNEPYNLKIVKYCLNDSAVVNEVLDQNNGSGASKELDISHNYSIQIILTKDSKIAFDKQISKDDFKERLVYGHYERVALYDIQYAFVKSNRLYFKATLTPLNTNWIEEIGFAVFYQTEKIGQLDFWEEESHWVTYNDLAIYDLKYHDKSPNEKVGFISMTDKYHLSEHPDSLAIPDLYSSEDKEYLKLDSTYRERFFIKTKISETDYVFIYNYSKDTIVSLPVKNLNVVASLNPYANDDDKPYSQYDYMIGFEIDKNVLEGFGIHFSESFVYVGNKNPFVQGQVKPIAWKKIEPTGFPSKATIGTKNTLLLRKYDRGNLYKYETIEFEYFVQDFLRDNRISARRLLIVDFKTKETVRDLFYFESEGSSLTPLNFTTDYAKYPNQWTGKLFKNKPPVVFGFEYYSFECPSITFLKQSVKNVYINCDARH